jgi:phosphoglycerate dehydrogenase-like enzyme
MGSELRDRTLGVIGLGGIARATLGLLASFGMRQPLAYDPWVAPEVAEQCNVRLVSLDELLAESDFVSIHCPLTSDTRELINAQQIAQMKPTAFLINTARGGIVDEEALYEALAQRRIAGAAIDCFENEPVKSPHRLGELDNVILAPHSIAWTNELFRDVGRTAWRAIVDLAHGVRPSGVVNPEVFDSSGFQAKWTRIVGRSG